MAFDSVSIITLVNPTVSVTVNDWTLSNTLTKPTVIATLNDYVVSYTSNIPTLDFTLNIASNFDLTYITSKPQLTTTLVQSSIFSLNKIVKTPSISFLGAITNTYTLTSTLPKIETDITLAVSNSASVIRVLKIPQLDFQAVFTATNTRQTWVFNTITTAHSRYTNYDFNSFFKLGTKQYGLNDSGIYEIGAEKDYLGEPLKEAFINAQIDFPVSNFGEQQMKVCSDAFIYMRADGDMEVLTVNDEQEQREGYIVYFDDRTGMHRRRVKIPKGLRGNAWQFKLKNIDGCDFDINAFEVLLKTIQRVTW